MLGQRLFLSLLNGTSFTLPLVVVFPQVLKNDREINKDKKTNMRGKLIGSNIHKDQ